jgi:2-(1,2-epoxy-1,2-dihydrophenyl)acetyl-CoA isomerase
MKTSGLVLEEKRDTILYLTLNRPEKLNSFLEPMREEIANHIQALHSRDDINVCVITGAGTGFCSGGDIKVMQDIIENKDYDRIQTFLKWGRSVVLGIRSLPIPVIAAVNGPAGGAGMNLALACDLRLVSSKASFGQTFINIALHPDWGGTYFLPHLTNTAIALDLIWTGRVISAEEAFQIGIANKIIPHEQFRESVEAYARDLAKRPKLVISQAKKGVYEAVRANLEALLTHEEICQAQCIRSKEAKEGMETFLRQRLLRKG